MVILKMNEIARNYNDDLTKRSFNNQQQSHMTQQVKRKINVQRIIKRTILSNTFHLWQKRV